jgi:hypothetical protein
MVHAWKQQHQGSSFVLQDWNTRQALVNHVV